MNRYTESQLQSQIILLLRKFYPDILFSGGFAGEKLNLLQAIRRKRMGYVAGTPDLIIFEPRGQFHGLMIEFKSKKGKQTEEQKRFQMMAEERGYKYIIIRTLNDFKNIEKYLSKTL